MNELQLFQFEDNQIRTVSSNGIIWFSAPDVTNTLKLTNTTVALKSLDGDEVTKFNLGGLSGETNFISEPGLYKLIGASRKPAAKRFNRWVTHEVLPSIRKHGAYMTPETIEKAIYNPDFIINLATQLKEERTGRLIAEQRINELQPKADYYDLILANKGLVTTTSIAKNYGMSASAFNQLLHSLGIQFNQSGSWYLYSKYQNHGYTHTVPVAFKHRDGRDDVKPNTKWTQKGHVFLYEELKKNDVIPVIEQKEMTV
ncbi:Phage antirepressor protein [Lacticaseibacillus paracasei subsp. paracasei Lpp225]|uniref:Phage antirepressor protein n=1 Tax=Lacticaseibacillus paracasei subsp. paracasei Lpp225 TaxID=1256225 RepID=S2N928_LACPA|nr:Phage antirepressor protein [Lacticaseibacillus paracasei subsp. paracasei Lpp225]